jgi:hypothetical protein
MTVWSFPGLADKPREFVTKVEDIAERLGTDPNYLLTVMQLESGIDPSATNKQGGATGLIQFMPDTAIRLGTTADALRRMTSLHQLDYVESFYRRYAGNLHSVGDVYMVTFYPDLAFKAAETVVARKGQAVYDQNVGLDVDKNGVLTVGDVTKKAENALYVYSLRGPYTFKPQTAKTFNGAVKDAAVTNIVAAAIVAAAIHLLHKAVKKGRRS